jgi:hypothetical protein
MEKQHSILGIRQQLSNNIFSNDQMITASLHPRRPSSSISNSTASVLVRSVTPFCTSKVQSPSICCAIFGSGLEEMER